MGQEKEKNSRMSRKFLVKALLAVSGLAICSGTLEATSTITTTTTSVALTCDTVAGPGSAVLVPVTLVAAGSSVTVTPTITANMSSPGPVVMPSAASVTSTSVATNFSFSIAAGCKGFVPGTTPTSGTITFTPTSGTAITVPVTLTVTYGNTALTPSATTLSFTCLKNSPTSYTASPTSSAVNVTSAAGGGTPFTVDTAAPYALPSWLTVAPTTGGTASTTPVALTFTPVATTSGCGALPLGTTTTAVHLLNAPAPDKVIAVSIEVGVADTLTASPAAVSMTYTTGTTTYSSDAATSAISASPNVFFTVDPTTVPGWLTVSPTTGTTPQTLTFTPTAGVQTLALGGYTANIHLKVSGELDKIVPVTLQVQNPTPTLTVEGGTGTRTINWTLGTNLPSLVITPVSSDAPIPFTVAVNQGAGSLDPQISATQGIAYNFGSPITVTFLQAVFAAAAPGTPLTGEVDITPVTASGPGTAIPITITVNVLSPGAAITSLSPSSVPVSTSGTLTVVVNGTGFVASNTPNQSTIAGVVSSGVIVNDPNVSVSVSNSTSLVVTITVPAANSDPYLPLSAPGSIQIGVCNPGGGSCSTPTGTATLTIGVNPIIETVTSGSSYTEVTAPAMPTIAPYDILTVFGANFCVSNGTGCTGSTPILYGALDPATLRYLTSLSPDPAGATQRNLTVTFQTHGGSSPTVIGTAPLLFANNTQINLIAPDALHSYVGDTVDMVVSFGYGSGATMLKSATYSVSVAQSDPGIFTVNGDGQGDPAAELPNYSLISSSNPANARNGGSGSADSDTISLYVSGLGRPDSTASGSGYSATCMPVGDYFANINRLVNPTTALTSDDGLVLQSAYFDSGDTEPCMNAGDVTVTIGSVSAPVSYAGWVSGSIAGLYQINAQLPASTSSSLTDYQGNAGAMSCGNTYHLPVVVTTTGNGKTSQASGVNVWAQPALLLTAAGSTLTGGTVTGTHGSALSAVTLTGNDATGSSPTYTYALANGSSFPTGLSFDNTNLNEIDGTPTSAGTTTTTITVSDSNDSCTGTLTLTFVIN